MNALWRFLPNNEQKLFSLRRGQEKARAKAGSGLVSMELLCHWLEDLSPVKRSLLPVPSLCSPSEIHLVPPKCCLLGVSLLWISLSQSAPYPAQLLSTHPSCAAFPFQTSSCKLSPPETGPFRKEQMRISFINIFFPGVNNKPLSEWILVPATVDVPTLKNY